MTHHRILLVASLALISWSCGVAKDVVGGMEEPKRESSRTSGEGDATSKLDLVPNALGLTPGDEFRFHTEMLDVSGQALTDPAGVVWGSSASDVLESKGDGLFVAKKIGEAKATATIGETTATATVTVQVAAACTAMAEFSKRVEPVMEEKCVACHSDSGSKAANGAFAMNPGAPDQNWQGAKTRLDAKDVASSKILRKVLGEDSHGGGAVLASSDAEYQSLQFWADAEAKCMNGQVMTALVLSPAEATIKAGTRIRLKVEGKMAAGGFQEITTGVEWKLLDEEGKPATIDVGSMSSDQMLTAGSKLGKMTVVAKVGAFEGTAVISVVPLNSASTCEAASLYRQNVDPIVQATCLSCHAQGGVGASVMTLAGPAPTEAEIAVNHDELLMRLNLAKISDSLLLGKITAKVTHGGGAVIAGDSPDYGKFSAWADGEAACFQGSANGLQVSPVDPVLTAGETLQLRALVVHPDGTASPAGQGVKWALESPVDGGALPAGTTVSSDGLLTTSAAGGVTAVATFGKFTAKTTVTVNPLGTADVQEVRVTPSGTLALPVGGFQALEIEVLYANGSKAYNPAGAMISSMNFTVADIDGRVVNAKAVGQTLITVAFGGKTATLTVDVAAPDCPSYQSFVTNFQTTVDDKCVACHGTATNPAFAALQLKSGSTCQQRHANWVNAKAELNYTSPLSSAILQKPLGQVTHGGNTVIEGAAADKLRAWISTATACFAASPAQEAATLLTVCPKTPTAIALNPAFPAVTVGATQNLVATVTYDDDSTSTTDADLVWTSVATAKMTVVKTAAGAKITGVAAGNTTLAVKVRGLTVNFPVTVQAAGVTLNSLAVDPATSSLGVGRTTTYLLKGSYSDGTTKTLTAGVTWASTDATKATVTNAGVVTAKAAGAVTIRGTYTDASCTSNCTVDGALTILGIQSIVMTPASKTLTVGQTQQVTAQVKYSDNSTYSPPNSSIVWASTATTKATVSTSGLVTGKAAGTANVTATFSGSTGTSAFTMAMPAGCSSFTTFKAPTTGVAALLEANCKTCHSGSGAGTPYFQFDAGASTCQQIAGVWEKAKEKVDLGDPGSSYIYAKPAGLVAHTGGSSLLTTAQKETVRQWALLSATCQAAGADTLTLAQLCPKQVASITVSPDNPSVTVGSTVTVVATVTYDDGTTSTTDSALTWTSASAAKFTVAKTAPGATLTGVASGMANLSVKVGTFEKIVPVVVQAAGVTLLSLAVDPATASVGLGQTKTLALKGSYSDGTIKTLTTGVTWTTSDAAKATVAAGVVTSKAAGAVTITAAYSDASCTANCSKTSAVTVVGVKTVALAPATKSLTVGQTQQMTVALTYLDNTTFNLPAAKATWVSAAASKAAVSAAGLVTAKAAGTAKITATYGGVSGFGTFTLVMPAGCPSFSKFKTAGASIAAVMESKCKSCHTGSGPGVSNFSFPAGATSCLQISTVWAAAKTKVNAASPLDSLFYTKPSLLVGHTGGKPLTDAQIALFKTWVQASAVCQLAGVDTQTNEELCPKTATSIAITPATPEVKVGKTLNLTATVTYDDGSTSTTAAGIMWTSTTPANGTIDATGKLTGVKVGTTQIKAQLGTLSVTANGKIINADITRIDVVPVSQSVAAGDTAPFTVKATYSNGVQGTLTTGVTWSSTATTVGTITAAGVAKGLMKGSTSIKATLPSCTNIANCPATGTLTVTDPVLRSIAITPANIVVTSGGPTSTLKVQGTYSNGSKQFVTTGVTWTSSDPASAEVSNTGVVKGFKPGYNTIRAAATGVASVSTGVLIIAANGCNTVTEYQNKIDPLFQNKCITCHGTGGQGSGFMQLKTATTAFDKMANWDEVRLRINATDVPNSKLLRKISGGLNHTGGAPMANPSTDFTLVQTWANHEAACIKENIPSNLTRNSGEVLFQRLQTLFPTAVSTADAPAKPLVARQFDMFYSSGVDRVLANTERSFSPVVLVAMRNKVNAVCKDYVDANDTKNTLFTWNANTLLAGESVPTNAVDKIVLGAARNAWLYPYVAADAEVGHLRTLYNAALAASSNNALVAKQMVCVGALTAPQFWFGNKGAEDAVRRLYLETLRKVPTMADYKAYRATAAANRTAYLKGLITTHKTTYLGAVKSWHRDWLALRDYYEINRGQIRPEGGIGLGATTTAMGISGVPVQELAEADTGFPRTIQLGLDRNTTSFADYSESCTSGVAQNFDPRTTEVRVEHYNPVSKVWEVVGKMQKQANGTWLSVNGQITLANGSKKTVSLADIQTTQQQPNLQQCYKTGGLVGTPIACFNGDRTPVEEVQANGAKKKVTGKRFMQRRIRRFSPSGEQNGYSSIKLWYSGETVKVCNSYSRFAMTCAYRPTEVKPPMTGKIDFNTGIVLSYSSTVPWNFKDGDRPKLGPPQLRDSFASPKVLDAYRCGVPDGDEIAKYGTSGYNEDFAYPRGYTAGQTTVNQANLNQIATNPTEFFKKNAVGLDKIIALNKDATTRPEDQAVGRLLEDLQAEPLNLVNDIVKNDRDFRKLLTADYTIGRTELELFYRSSDYYLPLYPPGYTPKRGAANTPAFIRESDIQPIPLAWLKNSWNGGFGAAMSAAYMRDEIADDEVSAKPMSGILTQTAFLGPVAVNNGKVRSLAARVFSRLLCGLPSDFVADLDGAAVTMHKAMISTAGSDGKAHVDESRGCYSCHINLDPMAASLKKDFKTSPDSALMADIKFAPLLGVPAAYGVRGGKPNGNGAIFGEPVSGIKDFGATVANTRQFSECVVKTGFINTFGRQPIGEELGLIHDIAEDFRSGYNYTDMIEQLISSDAYRRAN